MKTSQISREASDYDYDVEGHSGNRKRKRKIPLNAVEQCIEEGTAKEGKKNRVNFEAKWNGATMTVVANPRTNYIVTTFWGTGTTGDALKEAQAKQRQRKQKISERSGAAYTGGWQ
jgi:hypothetical protein